MKEKRGFTLVELLAVIALLAIVAVIGSYGVSGVKEAVKKQQWSNKVSLIESRAKVLGEDNKVLLTGQCTINEVPHNNAKIITVKNLIDKKYITTNEKDNHGDKIITNDITGKSVNDWKICVYLEDNTVYAKLADETTIEEGDTNPVEPVVPYNNPHIKIDTTSSSTNSIDVTMIATPGDSQIAKYMVSKDGGSSWTTINSSSTTYTHQFIGLTPNTEYNVKVKAIDTKGYSSNEDSKLVKTMSNGGSSSEEPDECVDDSDSLVKNICTNGTNLATCIKTQYTSQGSKGLYYHTSSLPNSAEDNSYRYAGSDCAVKNYVCFGSSATPCPEDNLYRIIGVFGNNVKLIKADIATYDLLGTDGDYEGVNGSGPDYKGNKGTISIYYWNNLTETNIWSESRLNKINLNTNFIKNIGSTWANKILEATWYVGGHTTYQSPAKEFYNVEKTATYKAKIGLMSVSDYGFATTPNNWTTNLHNYFETNVKNNNWIYMGEFEWTIIRSANTNFQTFAFDVYFDGGVNIGSMNEGFPGHSGESLRPSFYLNSNITYLSGNGTKTNPIRIN